ncbi:MAG: SUMF1/EgtB/PvdO family nonheme iron enzyme, partial [Planctomycetes bacterium]|nr:SUMF1/EgtB/PvdO family nonheme iron enzyme [Planctomycetota bacterium]
FDMHGNAWEWCHNLYRAPIGQPDVVVKEREGGRVLRGGAFNVRPGIVRSADRYTFGPDYRSVYDGFRAARTYNLSP